MPIKEKRQFPRFEVDLPVKFKIFDKETKTEITNYAYASTENISKSGLCLRLPKGWDCPDCNNCLGWMYNRKCHLKDSHTEQANRLITIKINLKTLLSDPATPCKEPIQLECDCIWIDGDIDESAETYPVGLSFTKSSRKRISSYLPNIFGN